MSTLFHRFTTATAAAVLGMLAVTSPPSHADSQLLRIATFNVSMEGGNYVGRNAKPSGHELPRALASGDHPQIHNIAEIIQRVRPDILLLNEFDYQPDPAHGVLPFLRNYLSRSHGDTEAITYPWFHHGPVNTGVDSGMDLDRDGTASGVAGDAFGYGLYPGQYGMLLLSRYPIDTDRTREFQHFLWKDMPGNLMADMRDEDGAPWYPPAAQQRLRLSSKSHWDIPVRVGDEVIHVLASHPTPPVFDGPEDRNGRRNHDEIRFWVDYLGDGADYIYDDGGTRGGLRGERFVLLGDLNASSEEGDARRDSITELLTHPRVQQQLPPTSEGGRANRAANPSGPTHTAVWAMRADYVIPSQAGWRVVDAGVFWPTLDDDLYRLVRDRRASSDHRLVWVDLELDSLSAGTRPTRHP